MLYHYFYKILISNHLNDYLMNILKQKNSIMWKNIKYFIINFYKQ